MFFPVYVNLKGEEALVIGGGKLGNRKTSTLREYGANVTVYSKNIVSEELAAREDIKFIFENVENNEEFISKLVENYFIVIAATDDLELNDNISKICMNKKILVNNVSSKEVMNTMFGAIIKNDEFHVAVSTNGKSCRRAKAMKSVIQKAIDSVK